jgi:hypothetical protein
VLIKEVVAEVRDGEMKTAKVDVLAKEETSEAKDTTEPKEKKQDGEAEIFED